MGKYTTMYKVKELSKLLINKSLSEQKEIITNFFYENRKVNRFFIRIYKSTKNIFEDSSLDDSYIQKFINKTFINLGAIDFSDWNTGYNIENIKISIWTPKILDLDDLTEKQKDLIIKNEK